MLSASEADLTLYCQSRSLRRSSAAEGGCQRKAARPLSAPPEPTLKIKARGKWHDYLRHECLEMAHRDLSFEMTTALTPERTVGGHRVPVPPIQGRRD
jgi:hypothetical protein